MPFTHRALLAVPERRLGADSLRHAFGAAELLRAPDRSTLSVSALIMPRVAIVEMATDALAVRLSGGAMRDSYPNVLCIVTAGAMRYSDESRHVDAGVGDVIHVEPNIPADHRVTYEFDDGFRGIFLMASLADKPVAAGPGGGADVLAYVSPLGDAYVAFLESLTKSADLHAREQDPETVAAADDIASYMFNSLVKRGGAAGEPEDHPPDGSLARALAAIRETANLVETTPSTIAARLNYSLGHMHHLFEGHARTIAEEIRFQRTSLALEALRDPRLRSVGLESISTSAGFSSLRSMRRAVTATTGMSPSEVRRNARAQRLERRDRQRGKQSEWPWQGPGSTSGARPLGPTSTSTSRGGTGRSETGVRG